MRVALFLAGASLLTRHAMALMQALPSGRPATSIVRTQKLKNFHDVSYTGTISIGGQQLQTVFDSGSFELVVLSKDCPHCSSHPTRLFNGNKSSTYTTGNTTSDFTYGGGLALTEGAYDDVSVEKLMAYKQFFWKVYDADESLSSLLQDNSFGAIFGLGPPTSVEAYAEYQLQRIRKEVQEYMVKGGLITPKVAKLIDTFEAKLKLAKSTTTLLEKVGMGDMSICLGKASGSPGYFTWNDLAAKEHPTLFLEVPVVGDFYWSAKLTDVRIGAIRSGLADKLSLPEAMTGPTALGCERNVCSAVMDTSTSFIHAPEQAVHVVENLLSEWEKHGGNCKDLSLLPDLEFNLGGHAFTLPPEAYVVEFTGSDDSLQQMRHMLPHLYKKHMTRTVAGTEGQSYSYCSSLISPMDARSQFGPLWIMGISFFREYYTSFHLLPHGNSLKAASMKFSRASHDCKPIEKPEPSPKHFITLTNSSGKRHAQFKLDVSRIRASALVERFHGMAIPKIPGLAELREQSPSTKRDTLRI